MRQVKIAMHSSFVDGIASPRFDGGFSIFGSHRAFIGLRRDKDRNDGRVNDPDGQSDPKRLGIR